ncbi:MAG: sodium:solute symporter [Planctomycetota bacterium]|jgi:SSS family solute:Na+ symporter
MEPLDWIVVALYFGVLVGVAVWVIRKGKDTADDYFLAGRHLGWFIVGASIFSSNIGSEHLVGLAGSGCTDGVAMAHYELHAWCLLVLAWVLVPFYMRSMVYTMPEFLEKRFSATARWVLAVVSLVAYVLTKIAVGIFAGGIVFSTLLPELNLIGLDSFWIGSFLVIIFTGIYTVLGGLRAVAYTEALQTLILVFGSLLVTIFGLLALWDAGGELRMAAYEHEGVTAEHNERFDLWKSLVPNGVEGTWDPVLKKDDQGNVVKQAWYFKGEGSSYPWLGMLFCAPIIGLWYWCTDQYIVQRALGAPNERVARRGTIFAAFLKLLPVFIFIIPGMIAFALWKSDGLENLALDVDKETGAKTAVLRHYDPETGKEKLDIIDEGTLKEMIATNDPELKNVVIKNNQAFPLMVRDILPRGIRGIVVAGLLSALMSSLAGVFNASSTLFTMDLYQKFKPEASQHQLVWIGRMATAAMVLIGLAWVPVIHGQRGLYDYLQTVQGYLAPPIFVVFFFGVFMKRLNGKGCLAALIVGFILGVFRLAVDTPVSMKWLASYQEGSLLWIINNVYFQYYSLFIFVVCIIVMIVVSYLTEPPSLERIRGLTYGTVTDQHRAESRASWGWMEVTASAVVLLAILAAYLYFTG